MGKYTINVQQLNGKKLSYQINPEENILAVKFRVFQDTSIPVFLLRFVFNGKELHNNSSFRQLGIPSHSTVHMVFNVNQSIQQPPPPPDQKKKKRGTYTKIACSNCRKAHASCDSGRPCRRCVETGKEDSCVDAPRKRGVRRKPMIKKEPVPVPVPVPKMNPMNNNQFQPARSIPVPVPKYKVPMNNVQFKQQPAFLMDNSPTFKQDGGNYMDLDDGDGFDFLPQGVPFPGKNSFDSFGASSSYPGGTDDEFYDNWYDQDNDLGFSPLGLDPSSPFPSSTIPSPVALDFSGVSKEKEMRIKKELQSYRGSMSGGGYAPNPNNMTLQQQQQMKRQKQQQSMGKANNNNNNQQQQFAANAKELVDVFTRMNFQNIKPEMIQQLVVAYARQAEEIMQLKEMILSLRRQLSVRGFQNVQNNVQNNNFFPQELKM